MLENGFIKLHRSLLKWEWYDDVNTTRLFIHLLLTVNYEDEKWRGIEIKRGQRISSYEKLSAETKLSKKNVRTALKHLISTGEVAHETTSTYGLFTVFNYDLYQRVAHETADEGQSDGTQAAHEGQQRKNTKNTKNSKNEKEEKEITLSYSEYGWIKLTEQQYDKLINEFGEPIVKYYIAYVDEFVQGNGNKNKYKDWNIVLRKAIKNKWGGEPKININSLSDKIKEMSNNPEDWSGF